jgi:hypothetical protein
VSVSGNPVADRALTAVTGGRIESWLQKYEDMVGLTEVKEAQNKVIEVIGVVEYLFEIRSVVSVRQQLGILLLTVLLKVISSFS